MQNAFRYFSLTAALTLCSPAFAAPIDAQAVNTAAIASLPIEAPAEKQTEPNPAIVHLQVLLDRAGSSPGVIDGYFGDNLTKAIAGFEALREIAVVSAASRLPRASTPEEFWDLLAKGDPTAGPVPGDPTPGGDPWRDGGWAGRTSGRARG